MLTGIQLVPILHKAESQYDEDRDVAEERKAVYSMTIPKDSALVCIDVTKSFVELFGYTRQHAML